MQESTRDEIDALKRESELPLEELLKTLPKEVFEKPASLAGSDTGGSGDESEDNNSVWLSLCNRHLIQAETEFSNTIWFCTCIKRFAKKLFCLV